MTSRVAIVLTSLFLLQCGFFKRRRHDDFKQHKGKVQKRKRDDDYYQ